LDLDLFIGLDWQVAMLVLLLVAVTAGGAALFFLVFSLCHGINASVAGLLHLVACMFSAVAENKKNN
jgi:hypothetical protein